MRLHQTGMRGHDAYAETVSAAFSGGNVSLVNVSTVAIGLATLIEHGRGRVMEVAVVYFAVVRFHADMLRIDCAQMPARRSIFSDFGFAWIPEIELGKVVAVEAAIAREQSVGV